MTRRVHQTTCKGGLDLVSQDTEISDGQLIHAINIEQGPRGGYRRIDGYERFDGRALSSQMGYWQVPCTALTVALLTGAVVVIGTAIAVALQDHAVDDTVLYLASSSEISEDTDIILGGATISTAKGFSSQEQQKLIASDAANDDRFGVSVAISSDGSTAIVGAYFEDGAGSNRGAAYVFTRTAGVWTQQQKLTASDAADNDYFGYSVSISSDGDTAIVGASLEDGAGTDRGAAYLFTRTAGVWTEQQKLTASDAANHDFFGRSVSISSDGDTAIIGAYSEDGAGSDWGAAYVFTRTAGVWTEQQKLTASDAANVDWFGLSVSISGDGNTVIVGAYTANVGGIDQGAAYVFTRTAEVWTEQKKLTASDAADTDYFGYSVAISSDGNTAIVGAYLEDDVGSQRGAAYVFTRTAGVWTQQQKLIASDAADHDWFGWSVSISSDGDTAVVGSHLEDGAGTDRGAAYVFTRTAGVWTEQQKLTASDAANGDLFGASVSVSSDGSTAIIGAYSEDGAGSNRGAVYVRQLDRLETNYETDPETHMAAWDAAQTQWRALIQPVPGSGDIRGVAMREGTVVAFRDNVAGTECIGYEATGAITAAERQVIYPNSTETDSYFGISVSISSDGNTAIVGAYVEDGAGTNRGAAYVFTRTAGVWTLQQKMTASDAADNDYFGYSVSISSDGTTAIVGAYSEDGAGTNRGAAYVFTRTAGVWTEQQKLTASDAANGDVFGYSVSISSDGSTAIIGAYLEDGAGTDRGAAYVFTRTAGVWTEQQKLTASDAADSDYFGYSVSISSDGGTAIVGAYREDGAGTDRGAAYVFTRTAGVWTEQQKLTASDAADDDYFGFFTSISSDGDTAIVGASLEDGAGTNRGAAYVFTRTAGVWTEQQKLTASDAADNDYFGYSVSISSDGDTAIVGASLEDGAGTDRGAAYLFTRTAGVWTEQQKLTTSDAADSDLFGYSVSISSDGSTAIVGAYPGGATNRAYVFDLQNGWENITRQDFVEQQEVLPTNAVGNGLFGDSVTINGSGKYAAVGHPGNGDRGTAAGAVQLLERYGEEWSGTGVLYPPNIEVGAQLGVSVSLSEDGLALAVGAPGAAVLTDVYYELQKLTASDATAGDRFGNSVSISSDGVTAVIGAYSEDGAGSNRGAAYVFTHVNGVWTQQQKLIASDPADNDNFGISVAISGDGDTVIIGANKEDGAGTDRGAAYAFTRTAGVWTERQKILPSTALADSDHFGSCVSISDDGDTAVIGAWGDDTAGADAGAAYVFTRAGFVWTQQQKLTASGAVAADYFGQVASISSDGNTIVIGTTSWDGVGTNRGAAYVFTRTAGVWAQQQRLLASDAADNDNFASGVAISGDGSTIAVGARTEDGVSGAPTANVGAVYIFTVAAGVWTEQQKILASNAVDLDQFGSAVTLSVNGDTVAVTAKYATVVSANTGSAYIFTRTAGVWTEQQRITAFTPTTAEYFGDAIAVSADASTVVTGASTLSAGGAYIHTTTRYGAGTVEYFSQGVLGWGHVESLQSDAPSSGDGFGQSAKLSDDKTILVAGAPYKSKNNLSNAGYVYVFERDGTWQLRSVLSLDAPAASDYFGYSVDLSETGNTVVVGQYGKTVSANAGAGAVLIYDRDDNEWALTQTIDAPNPEVSGNFGYSVAISADGSVLAIGAPNEDALGTDDGRVYIYELVSGTWTLKQTTLLEGGATTGNQYGLGRFVDLNNDGSVLTCSQGTDAEAGMVNIFSRQNDYWTPVWRKTASDASAQAFGQNVQISPNGEHFICGAPTTGVDVGQAYVFTKSGAVLQPAGDYDFDVYNFIGTGASKYLYGADKVNKAFEYTGSIFRQITTGMEVDTPSHVLAHKQHLFLSYGSSLQHSSLGDPRNFTLILGAAEVGISENITGMERLRGGEMGVFGRNRTFVLYGTSSLDWELNEFSRDTGALEWTIQPLSVPVFLDDRGIASLASVQEHGNFSRIALSKPIEPVITAKRGLAVSSTIVREKDQYRLFFSDGLGIIVASDADGAVSLYLIKFDHPVLKTVSAEGVDGKEHVYFGSSSGYIYRMESGISFDGEAFKSSFRLARNSLAGQYGPDLSAHKKRFFKAVVTGSARGHSELSVTLDIDYGSSYVATEQPITLTFVENAGFWEDEGLDIGYDSRHDLHIKGNGRDVSYKFEADSKLIYPFTIDTVMTDWSLRRRVN